MIIGVALVLVRYCSARETFNRPFVTTFPLKADVYRIPRPVDHVYAMHIIDIAIAVIIDSVRGFVVPICVEPRFTGIAPHVRPEVFVSVVHPGVEDCNYDIRAARSNVPSGRCRNLWEVPLRTVAGIVWPGH